MKYLLMMGLIFSQFAQAEVIKCISEDNKFEIVANVDFENKKVENMDYFKNGVKYLSFSNLDMDYSNNIFTGRRDTYSVLFSQSALYMELVVGKTGSIYGNFLPKNSIIAIERAIYCERQ